MLGAIHAIAFCFSYISWRDVKIFRWKWDIQHEPEFHVVYTRNSGHTGFTFGAMQSPLPHTALYVSAIHYSVKLKLPLYVLWAHRSGGVLSLLNISNGWTCIVSFMLHMRYTYMHMCLIAAAGCVGLRDGLNVLEKKKNSIDPSRMWTLLFSV